MTGTTEALARQLGDAARARGWLVATAESCTGGLVAAAITAIPGSSEWFDAGFVTYSNEAKQATLHVPAGTLAHHGAVSEETALAMAQGALAASNAQLAVAITGIAGPGGGTPAKPVGMVCFGWSTRSGDALARTHHLRGDRSAVRIASVDIALRGLIALASDEKPAIPGGKA